jgi:hypothetical protein
MIDNTDMIKAIRMAIFGENGVLQQDAPNVDEEAVLALYDEETNFAREVITAIEPFIQARIAELEAALKKIAELRYSEHALEPLDEAIDIAEQTLGITISE